MAETTDRLLTMAETMEYLTERGFPCRSRSTFYKVVEDFNIPFVDTNPQGKNRYRRFPLSGLHKFLEEQGLES